MGMHDVGSGSAGSSKIIICLYLNILIGKNNNNISESGNDAPFLSLLRFARNVENRMKIALFYLIVCWIAAMVNAYLLLAKCDHPTVPALRQGCWILLHSYFPLVYVMRQTHNQTNMSFKKINILV